MTSSLRVTTCAATTVLLVATAANAIELAKTEPGCSAFTAAQVERSLSIARAVMTSNAYAQCANRRLTANYRACLGQDPSADLPLDQQIAKIFQALNNHNNAKYTCSYSTASNLAASTAYQPWGGIGEKVTDLADDWMWSFGDWYTDLYRLPGRPFNWRTSDLIHEFLHAHGYKHPDDNPDGRAACNAQFGSYDGGTNSAPYIMGICADNVLTESADHCDVFGAGPGAVNVVSSLAEFAGGRPVTCQTVYDPRHRAAFRTLSGNYLSAIDGGGGEVDAHAIGQGPWETVSVIPSRSAGATLRSGTYVRIKAEMGYFFGVREGKLVAESTQNFDEAPEFQITKVGAAAGTAIQRGDRVNLRQPGGSYVTAEYGGGGTVSVNRGPAAAAAEWETFIYEEPRRANVVRLIASSTGHRLYVLGNAYILADGRDSFLPDDGEERSAFWIVDHNGGALMSGDTVSIETLRTSKFVTRCVPDSDRAGATADTMQQCSKFVIGKVGGSGSIGRGDTVTFRTTEGEYLTSVPIEAGLLTHYTHTPGVWERFVIQPAQENRWPIQ